MRENKTIDLIMNILLVLILIVSFIYIFSGIEYNVSNAVGKAKLVSTIVIVIAYYLLQKTIVNKKKKTSRKK